MNDFYWLAFSMIPGVGGKTARQLLDIIPIQKICFWKIKKVWKLYLAIKQR